MFDYQMILASPAGWLPLAFALIMAISMLAYVILDGYDLGVGILLRQASTIEQKDMMVASIGPFGMRTKPGWCLALGSYL